MRFRLARFMRKEYAAISILTVGGAVFTFEYCRHAFLAKHFSKYQTARGTNGEPVQIRATMTVLFEETLSDLKFTTWNKNFFTLFPCKGITPLHYGSTKVREGVWVGIPHHFQAINEDEIISSDLRLDKKPIDWTSAEGEQLLQSLQLGDNAIKFAMAKEILLSDSYKFAIESFLPTFISAGFYAAVERAHTLFNLMHKPVISSIYVHSGISLLFVILYLFLKDGINLSYEKSVEEKIFKIGEAYIVGGIEYYEKAIERNKALRSLTKAGAKRYSVAGNETSFIRTTGLPLTFKLKVAHEALEKYYNKKEATKIPTPRKPQPIF